MKKKGTKRTWNVLESRHHIHAGQTLVDLGTLIIEVSRPHSDTPHSVGLLWTSDRLVAETTTWQHTTLTRDRPPRRRRDSNPQSQQVSERRATPRPRGCWDSLDPFAVRCMLVTSRDISDVRYLADASGICAARHVSMFCKMRSSAYDVGCDKRNEPISDFYGLRSLCGW
jgi:hypothetical protein